jgi:ABC-type transport system substrate-binding protein
VSARRVSRRRFLAGTGAAAGAGAALVLAGCDDNGEVEPTARPVPTETPEPEAVTSRGGVLRAFTFDAMTYDTLDPHRTQFGPVVNMHSAVFSKLLRYEDERAGTIVPDLATALPEQPDELTYVIRLRRGIRFHDEQKFRMAYPQVAGRELDAEDVRASIERQLTPEGDARGARFYRRSQWNAIDRIQVRDEHTLVIRLRTPVAPFTSFLAGRHAFILPREIAERGDAADDDLAMIGTGPFVLDSFEPGVAVRLKRNPDWFARDDDPDGIGVRRPYVDRYDSYMTPENDDFLRSTFERRQVDRTSFVTQEALDRVLATNLRDIALEETDAGGVLASRLLLDRAPFQDDRVRRAVHLAVDRRELAEALYPPATGGRPSARLSGPIAPALERWAIPEEALLRRPGYRAEPEQRAEDLANARQLWQAALGDDPPDIPIYFVGVPKAIPDRAVGVLQRQLREALGARVLPLTDPSGFALIGSAFGRNRAGAAQGVVPFSFAFEDGGVDLDDCLYAQFHSGQAENSYRLQDATLDAMLEEQRRTFDEDARRQLGLDIQDYLLGKVNARLEFLAPVRRRLSWGYVRNAHVPLWHGSGFQLADCWLDTSHAAWRGRPA